MSSDKFLRGAMILTLAGLMVKVIGSVNRILLSRLLPCHLINNKDFYSSV